MPQYIDIHTHILPGIDDGSKDMEMTIQMLKIAQQQGITEIIATPHFHPGRKKTTREEISQAYDSVCAMMKDKFPKIQLHLGNEIFHSVNMAEALEQGEIFTLADSSYVLVEFLPDTDFRTIQQALNNLQLSGYLPIIAHVERYTCILKQFALIEELNEMGVYIQVNASSVTGNHGWLVKRFIKKMMQKNLLHFVATDAHSNGNRAPLLKEAAFYIEKKMGSDYAKRILYDNPRMVITNRYI